MKRTVFIVLVTLFLNSIILADVWNPASKMSFLTTEYESNIYRAFYSSPEFKHIFPLVFGVDEAVFWNGNPPMLCWELETAQKEQLVSKAKDYLRKQDEPEQMNLLNRLENWCIVDKLFSFIVFQTATEYLSGALFDAAITRDLFEFVLANRGISKNSVPPGWGGGDLASAEYQTIYDSAVNRIARLSLEDRFKYFSEIFDYLSKQTYFPIDD